MSRILALPVCLVALLALGAIPAAAQDYEKGLAAARAGDFAAAIAQWRPLAEAGHAEALYGLGAIYDGGLGTAPDLRAAVEWYARAAAQGHARAQYNLGVMYADGRGVPRDDARAAEFFRQAAEQGHAKAQYNLGVLYRTGRGVPQDPARAAVWFERARAGGVAPTPPREAPAATASEDTSSPAQVAAPPAPPAAASPDVAARPPDASPAVAEPNTGTLRLDTRLAAGARYRLTVDETRERRRAAQPVMAQAAKFTVDMTVRRAESGGTVVAWTYGPATFKAARDGGEGRLAGELGKLIEGQRLEYRIDAAGAVIGLANPAEVAGFYEDAIARVVGEIERRAGSPQAVEALRASLRAQLTDDQIVSASLELPRLLHFFSGRALSRGVTYEREVTLALPPHGAPLPARQTSELVWFDRAAGVAWLRWRRTVDDRRAAAALTAYLNDAAAEVGLAPPDDIELDSVALSDQANYEIDLATGFPNRIIYTRRIDILGFSQVERRRVVVAR